MNNLLPIKSNEVFARNFAKASQQITEHRRLPHPGDGIMNAAVTDYLFEKLPQAGQGVLTQKSQSLEARASHDNATS